VKREYAASLFFFSFLPPLVSLRFFCERIYCVEPLLSAFVYGHIFYLFQHTSSGYLWATYSLSSTFHQFRAILEKMESTLFNQIVLYIALCTHWNFVQRSSYNPSVSCLRILSYVEKTRRNASKVNYIDSPLEPGRKMFKKAKKAARHSPVTSYIIRRM
jgi:hypothetical protein